MVSYGQTCVQPGIRYNRGNVMACNVYPTAVCMWQPVPPVRVREGDAINVATTAIVWSELGKRVVNPQEQTYKRVNQQEPVTAGHGMGVCVVNVKRVTYVGNRVVNGTAGNKG